MHMCWNTAIVHFVVCWPNLSIGIDSHIYHYFSIWLKDLPHWTEQCHDKWRWNVWLHCDLGKSSFKKLKTLKYLKAHHSILEVLWFQKTLSKSPEIYINWFASHVVLNGLINVYVSFALINSYIF